MLKMTIIILKSCHNHYHRRRHRQHQEQQQLHSPRTNEYENVCFNLQISHPTQDSCSCRCIPILS